MKTLWRRIAAAVSGSVLMPTALAGAYVPSLDFYKEHYSIPREKYGILIAPRWQDIVFLLIFWAVALMILFFSYRLLKYAIKNTR